MVAIFIIMLILFIPIPLKLKVEVINKGYNLYLYNKSLKNFITKKIRDKKSSPPSKDKKEPEPKTKKKVHIKELLTSLKNSKFKIKLNFNCILDYGLDDAFNVAMIFPLLNSISPFLFFILSIPFSMKKYKMVINPKFNCSFIKLEVESIIFLSIAKIIYVLILVLKNISKEEIENDRKSSNWKSYEINSRKY